MSVTISNKNLPTRHFWLRFRIGIYYFDTFGFDFEIQSLVLWLLCKPFTTFGHWFLEILVIMTSLLLNKTFYRFWFLFWKGINRHFGFDFDFELFTINILILILVSNTTILACWLRFRSSKPTYRGTLVTVSGLKVRFRTSLHATMKCLTAPSLVKVE